MILSTCEDIYNAPMITFWQILLVGSVWKKTSRTGEQARFLNIFVITCCGLNKEFSFGGFVSLKGVKQNMSSLVSFAFPKDWPSLEP